ncbi:sulfate transporter [Leptolyngbya sp. 'hensonii']|uniref:STAS domain-containing protein n=1 Tax=Leptolyngbya sp. 'hensonii' TaxID=1922337 RepID=UPI00094FEBAC|nr:STAS domain-containing protein [Leptolyngbya sp. 'hensonii']OLP15781.1 sulfate transporter [Leptolyngbya sp. 'hensonii']
MSAQVKVLQPSGMMDTKGGIDLRHKIINLLESGTKTVLIDFEQVTFMDSSGLGALVASLQRVRADNARLYLCSLNTQVRMVMELTRLDQVFEMFPDRSAFEAAVAPINQS